LVSQQETRNGYKILVKKPEGKRRDYLGDLSIDEMVILKCILNKLGAHAHT
jgi:hypothetical protein